jgi:hypothetical protein
MKTIKPLQIRHLKFTLILFFTGLSALNFYAQTKGDTHSGQAVVIRIEGNQNGWSRGSDNDTGQGTNTTVTANENVSFTGTSEGIYVTITSGINNIKLFALTGQLLFNGDLTQGRFIIKTRTGIYFLKVNNKSYKVICK